MRAVEGQVALTFRGLVLERAVRCALSAGRSDPHCVAAPHYDFCDIKIVIRFGERDGDGSGRKGKEQRHAEYK